MSRSELQKLCKRAERLTLRWKRSFPKVDRIELFHYFKGALTSPEENMRQILQFLRLLQAEKIPFIAEKALTVSGAIMT